MPSFASMWRGWFVGSSLIMIASTLFVGFTSQETSATYYLLGTLGAPPVAAVQGVLMAGIIKLGLLVWPIKEEV